MKELEVELEVGSLRLSDEEIWRTMGVRNNDPDELMLSLIDEISKEILSQVKPKYCYRFVDEVDFKYGRIIDNGLSHADRYLVIVSTVGEELDRLLQRYQSEDIVRAFVVDAIGSEMAEAVQRAALDQITQSELREGEKMSNPYSPGYCGWLLKEQKKLFAYFDKAPCGIVLNDSCLMLPIKSISSVVAVGREVEKAPYGCDICTKTDCYKKRKSVKQ